MLGLMVISYAIPLHFTESTEVVFTRVPWWSGLMVSVCSHGAAVDGSPGSSLSFLLVHRGRSCCHHLRQTLQHEERECGATGDSMCGSEQRLKRCVCCVQLQVCLLVTGVSVVLALVAVAIYSLDMDRNPEVACNKSYHNLCSDKYYAVVGPITDADKTLAQYGFQTLHDLNFLR